jgi:hypothetical protein
VNNQFTLSGVIEQSTDMDVVKFNMPSNGMFHLEAIPYNVGSDNTGSDLDIQVEILKNNSNNIIGTYNPSSLLNASIDTVLDAGNYYLRIQGRGNIYAPQYASLGSYSVQATFTPFGALPLHRLELTGSASNGRHKFNWVIDADETVVEQSLEVSANARDFQTVSPLSASARQFNYTPANTAILYYRLNVTFDNGRQYYSNVVAIRNNTDQSKPYLISNTVQANLTVNSPAAMTYRVNDYSGRLLESGKVTTGVNTINVSRFSAGMYLIEFSNGQEQFVEKFIKR